MRCLQISHKIGAIAASDRIYLMRTSKVDACGTHNELMNNSPAYQELFAQGQKSPSNTLDIAEREEM